MPNLGKKWDATAERDLCVAIITSTKDRNAKYDWPQVHALMTSLGYDFTRDAISQHHTKVIMKDFKTRHGNISLDNAKSASNTPKKATPAPKTPNSKKRSASKTPVGAIYEDDDESTFGSVQKKLKFESPDDDEDEDGMVFKDEPGCTQRARSSTVMNSEETSERGFKLWADRH